MLLCMQKLPFGVAVGVLALVAVAGCGGSTMTGPGGTGTGGDGTGGGTGPGTGTGTSGTATGAGACTGTGPGTGTGTGSHFDRGDSCATVSSEATLTKRPVDVIFVIDNSGSMPEEIVAVQNNINSIFAQI